MKKIVILLFVLTVSVCGFAQKGRMGVGGSLGAFYGDDVVPTLSVKYQYNLTDIFRIQPSVMFQLGDNYGCYMFAGHLDLHTFFIKNGRFRPYLITGVGYGTIEEEGNGYDSSSEESIFCANLGLGLNYRVSYSWDVQLEVAYNSVSEGAWIQIGTTYNF